jgi:hypothetical protein
MIAPTPSPSSLLGSCITAVCLTIVFSLWLFLDYFLSISLNWGLLPLVLLAGGLIALPGLSNRSHRNLNFVLVAIFATAIFTLPFLDITPAKPFYRFYSSIRPGMSIAEVQKQLDQYFPDNGKYPKPVAHGIQKTSKGQEEQSFQLDPNQGAYNAEIVNVTYSKGQVVSANYSPD